MRSKIFPCLSAITFCFPLSAHANAIVPYMVVPWGQVFLLPLVILIEGAILYKLAGNRVMVAMFQSFLANIVSTVIGAALYFAIMPLVGRHLFEWWFKGGFASEAIRNAGIALCFAVALWTISWVSETLVIARLRKTTFKGIAPTIAWANVVTYVLLLALSLALTF
jgi:hypothetical protein